MLEKVYWEDEQKEKDLYRVFGEETKNFKDPRKNKLKDYRNSRRGSGWYFNKESKSTRKAYQRKVRRRLNKIPYREEFYNVRCRDYKTYGWIDW